MDIATAWSRGICSAALGNGNSGVALYIAGFVLAALISYVLGSLNFGIIISNIKYRQDIRQFGSKNAGMTNMLRTYGKGAAVITLVGDALKAVVSVMVVGHFLAGYMGAYVAGLGCVVGHIFPVFYHFKGGKGVVTTAAMVLCLDPVAFVILFAVFVIIVAFTRYVSMGSIIGVMMYPLMVYKIRGPGMHIFICIAVAALVIWMHRSNIARLREGKENKLSFKSAGKEKKEQDNTPGEPQK